MNTTEYIDQRIEELISIFPDAILKYVYFENDIHIITYPDYLEKEDIFISIAYNFIESFQSMFNEDIVILKESDDYFEIDSFDNIYKGYIKDKEKCLYPNYNLSKLLFQNLISVECSNNIEGKIRCNLDKPFHPACDDQSYTLAA